MSGDIDAILRDAGLTTTGITQWWHARSRFLGGARPIDRHRTDPDDVFRAAVAFRNGDYL